MLTSIYSIAIYMIIYMFLLTMTINIFHPITSYLASFVLFCSLILSIISAKKVPIISADTNINNKRIDYTGITITLLLLSYFIIVINRVSIGVDTNVYHLPTSILMNHSLWYPGIGMLSVLMSFNNGTSVLASLFTSFNRPGLEFVPGFMIWVLFGVSVFLYLRRKDIRYYISVLTAGIIMLTPRLFWESYNMGTDMPMAFFIAFGFIFLSEKDYKNAALFFALSSAFKPLGQVAFIIFMAVYTIYSIYTRDIKKLFNVKVILGCLIFMLVSLKLYIATGNPFYPALQMKLVPWGMSVNIQQGIVANIYNIRQTIFKPYAGSFMKSLLYIRDFFFLPNRMWCSNWFSPVFLASAFGAMYVFIKDKKYKTISVHSILVALMLIFFIVGWFQKALQIRLILGILTAMMLIFLRFSLNKEDLPAILKFMIYISLAVTFLLFGMNVGKHYKNYMRPVLGLSQEEVQKHMPYRGVKDMFKEVTTEEGFTYTVSKSGYCGRSKPPCFHSYTPPGNREATLKEYLKYNRKFIKLQ